MRDRLRILSLIMLATAFLSEMKMNLFDDKFRFSLGIAAFFFGMLWYRLLPVVVTGLSVGVFIFLFRVGIDLKFYGMVWTDSLTIHLPAVFYYLSFAILIRLTNLRNAYENPFRVGVIGALTDVTSNYVELFVRYLFGELNPFTWKVFFVLLLFGALRSFFVVGLYNIFSIRQVRALGEARQYELERLLLISSNLFEEAFYLKKSMGHMEEITRKSYQLYRRINDLKIASPLSTLALQIAENVHEVKKDSQRILAGLSKIINQDALSPKLSLEEVAWMAIRANQKYAEMLGKQIRFSNNSAVHLYTNQIYALLSVLNNLVANAVESIPTEGDIQIATRYADGYVVISVTDNGPGIAEEDKNWVFRPGFTTKYDSQGNPSTGIGLSHVRDIIYSLKGTVSILSEDPNLTQFEIRVPTSQLMGKE